jgi:hypothetical protein
MDQKREFGRLDLHSLRVGLASLAVILFGVVSLLLYLNPTIIGVSPKNAVEYQGNFIWLLTAMLFLILGVAFFLVAWWWSRRLKWIVRSQKARPMRLQFDVKDDSDSTSYYALLHSPNETSGRSEWRVAIWLKPACVKADAGNQFDAQVYFDPKSGKPAAIEYEHGFLWIMAG